ncbi:hypothetical protein [Photobacterium atrarenae]|uniref:Uncharacterized protein n=1 Tax=Photobacterium atrarenae TaxID=865757 RepID=A0ABY5GHY1_9GAMM|nr:hypothetical protein [Photobacterium atrarenae]UTV28895.1 hypothetical protein NNL38_06590 [Photobacterium atrarenae]
MADYNRSRAGHSGQPTSETKPTRRMSMHEGIAPWCDCCVCEAEPYWAAVAEELGIELSDYEDGEPH